MKAAGGNQAILRRKASGGGTPDAAPASIEAVVTSPGHALDGVTQAFMAPRFGRDFGDVRLHTDADAAASAQSVGALAYTVGRHIVFGAGQFAPGTDTGKRLIAHELAHTVQQGAGGVVRRKDDLADCLAQTNEILPPHVGALTIIKREQELTEALGAAYDPFKQVILRDVAARTVVCLHGVAGVLALWQTRTPEDGLDVPAAEGVLRTVAVPLAPEKVMPVPGPHDFEINRVNTFGANEVSFARGKADVDVDAWLKIYDIKLSSPGAVRLIGYVSDDEDPTLAQRRADAVKKVFLGTPIPIAVAAAVANTEANRNKPDFARARSVDVVIASMAAPTLSCRNSPAKGPCPIIDPPTQKAFEKAHKIANRALADTVAALAGTPSPDTLARIDRFFLAHDAATLDTLRANFAALTRHVINLEAELTCANLCEKGDCGSGTATAYNNGDTTASATTLCVPAFLNMVSDNGRAGALIHEASHGTAPLGGGPKKGSNDLAYRHERAFRTLVAGDRLHNADNYALFAMFVHEGGSPTDPKAWPSGIPKPSSDDVASFTEAGPDRPALMTALVQAEKRLTWSKTRIGQVYGAAVIARTEGKGWADTTYLDVMTEAAKLFPLTKPPATPTLTDQFRLAAMLDRYLRLQSGIKKNLTVTRAPLGGVIWGAPVPWLKVLAGPAVSIGPDFFRADAEDRISLLIEALAHATPEVEPAFIPNYVALAAWLHHHALDN